jgi:hypothetical protein
MYITDAYQLQLNIPGQNRTTELLFAVSFSFPNQSIATTVQTIQLKHPNYKNHGQNVEVEVGFCVVRCGARFWGRFRTKSTQCRA